MDFIVRLSTVLCSSVLYSVSIRISNFNLRVTVCDQFIYGTGQVGLVEQSDVRKAGHPVKNDFYSIF